MRYSLVIVGLFLSIILPCGCAKAASNNFQDLKQVVIDYGDALESLSASSQDFGADTETAWAIDTVKAIWNNCKLKPFDVLQYMTDISVMQAFFAYGVDYVPMTFYWSKHYSEAQAGTETYKSYFDEDMHFVYELSDIIKDRKDELSYFIHHAYSLNLLDLYFAFSDDLNNRSITPQFASMYNLGNIDKLYQDSTISPLVYAWQLDGTSFYMTYCTWIRRTMADPNNNEAMPTLIEYANIFDSYAKPINNAIYGNAELPRLTESDLYAYLQKTLPLRTEMLRMLKKNIENAK